MAARPSPGSGHRVSSRDVSFTEAAGRTGCPPRARTGDRMLPAFSGSGSMARFISQAAQRHARAATLRRIPDAPSRHHSLTSTWSSRAVRDARHGSGDTRAHRCGIRPPGMAHRGGWGIPDRRMGRSKCTAAVASLRSHSICRLWGRNRRDPGGHPMELSGRSDT